MQGDMAGRGAVEAAEEGGGERGGGGRGERGGGGGPEREDHVRLNSSVFR